MIIQSVTFFGWLGTPEDHPEFIAARSAAKMIAQSGRRIVNGGGPGIMLAATLGAKDAGGKTSVVYYKPKFATNFEGKVSENFADSQYEEENYVDRTKRLLELGDLYIICNGGSGTISEFAMAWGLARLYFGHHKPLILFGEFWHDIMKTFKREMHVRAEEYEVFKIITKVEDILPAVEEFERIIEKNRKEHPINAENSNESFLLL